jgi:fructose-bisphosphate aldolase class 1
MNAPELNAPELMNTARTLVAADKVLLAMDESNPSCNKHFARLAFSFARAIQQRALEIWHGKEDNAPAAQQALLHRARRNRAARGGEYSAAMEHA